MSEHHIFKYHGTANDFVVMRDTHPLATAGWAPLLCDRNRGVGADGLLILGEPEAGGDVRLTIINADGSRPEMCGNGVRCVARHLVEVEGFEPSLVVESDAGPRPLEVVVQGTGAWQVAVDMGVADVAPDSTVLAFDDVHLEVRKVDMGNPHAVAFIDTMPSMETVDAWGHVVNGSHPEFPNGVNLELVVGSSDRLDVVVYERGVGRTQACGTGACAVAAAAWLEQRHPSGRTIVGLPGGDLAIEPRAGRVWMTGPVEAVFRATVDEAWVEQRKRRADKEVSSGEATE